MISKLAILFLTIVIVTQLQATEASLDAKTLAESVLRDSGSVASGQGSADAHAHMVPVLKKALSRSPTHDERVTIRAALVRLEDEETITGLLQGFTSSTSPSERASLGEAIKLANAAWTIPRLVEFVFLDDRLENVEGEAMHLERKSIVSARLIVELLSSCPEFNSRTRAAAKLISVLSGREIRDRVRLWWPANRVYFERKDYKAVKSM